jgi:hypothetical protein
MPHELVCSLERCSEARRRNRIRSALIRTGRSSALWIGHCIVGRARDLRDKKTEAWRSFSPYGTTLKSSR